MLPEEAPMEEDCHHAMETCLRLTTPRNPSRAHFLSEWRSRAALAMLLLPFWPLIPWYVARSRDGGDEPVGLGLLAIASVWLWRRRDRLDIRSAGLAMGALISLFALLAHGWLPPIMEGLLAVITLALVTELWRASPGIVMLLLLSLPWSASLQFFLGFPMRWLSASFAAALLRMTGIDVVRSGTDLLSNGFPVGVDPPCSGVHMLWTGLVTTAILAEQRRLAGRRFIGSLIACGILVVFGNALRSALLFFPESGLTPMPHWTHEAVGIVVFALALFILIAALDLLARGQSLHPRPMRPPSCSTLPASVIWLSLVFGASGSMARWVDPRKPSTVISRHLLSPANPGDLQRFQLPEFIDASSLAAQPLTPRERAFAADFPGTLQRYASERIEVLVRQALRPTRRLHSSVDCLTAAGFTIEPQSACIDEQGNSWHQCTATRSGERYRMLERIVSADGHQWSDVSAWFWSAFLQKSQGPWTAITILLPEQANGEHDETSPHSTTISPFITSQ